MRPELNRQNCGVLDIGSNSVRFVIYEVFGAAFSSVYDEKVLAGLGRDLRRTGRLHEGGKERALRALKRFAVLARHKGLEDRLLIASTAALRDAEDAADFISRVRMETGLDITPLSGPEEAKCAALGVIANEKRARGLVADLGGASLEMTQIGAGQVLNGRSYRLGPFALYDGEFEPDILRPKIKTILGPNWAEIYADSKALYLVGGAWRNLANIHQKRTQYPLRLVQNYKISRREAQALARWAISKQGRAALLSWPNVSRRRAETLPYSGLMLDILLGELAVSDIVIAPGGLRDGLVYQSLGPQIRKRDALLDACAGLVMRDAAEARMGQAVYGFISACLPFAEKVLGAVDGPRLLQAACMLSGVGLGLHPAHRAQIVYEIALYGPLSGLTHKERAWLALCVFRSFRSTKTPPAARIIESFLNRDGQTSAALCGEAIRAAIVLSARTPDILTAFELKADRQALVLSAQAGQADLLIERSLSHFQALAGLMGKAFRFQQSKG